jgi:hypothetical protein
MHPGLYGEVCSSVSSARSLRPSIPYISCSEPSGFDSRQRASSQPMNASASSVNPMRNSP